MDKYTYQDWWEGKVYLYYSGISYPINDNNLPPVAQWNNIIEADISKIKKKQKELFESKRRELYKKWCKIFIEKYKNSDLKEALVKDEIADFTDMLFNRDIRLLLENGRYRFRNHVVFFEENHLHAIQQYALDIIKNGGKINYDFIHSPNFKYQRNDIIAPEPIYAQSIWDYIKWLKLFKGEPEKYMDIRNIDYVENNSLIKGIKSEKHVEKPIGDFISEAEAKKMFSKSTTWFWNKRKKGLKFSKIGGTVYYSLADIKKHFEMEK